MEAVPADAVLLVIPVGERVHERFGGHFGVEEGVEHDHLRSVGHFLDAGLDSEQMRRVVQRGDIENAPDFFQNPLRGDHRLDEFRPPVDKAVADRPDFGQAAEHSVFPHQAGEDMLHGHIVVLHRQGAHLFRPVAGNMREYGVLEPDTLHKPFRQHGLGGCVHELVFHRGTSAVDNQYLQTSLPEMKAAGESMPPPDVNEYIFFARNMLRTKRLWRNLFLKYYIRRRGGKLFPESGCIFGKKSKPPVFAGVE